MPFLSSAFCQLALCLLEILHQTGCASKRDPGETHGPWKSLVSSGDYCHAFAVSSGSSEFLPEYSGLIYYVCRLCHGSILQAAGR